MVKKRLIFLLLLLFPVCFADAKISDKQFVVVIDPGHGGKDTGAIGSTAKEKNVVLSVALLLGDYITQAYPDVKVVFTRKADVFIELDDRANKANKAKADLFISIHTNSVKPNKKPHGAETYTFGLARTEENLEVAKQENSAILLEDNYEQKYEGFDPNSSESYIIFEFMQNKFVEQSIDFASLVQNELIRTGKRSDRGVRQSSFLVLRKASMPRVLVELDFLSNPEAERYLNSRSGQSILAKSLYNAFDQYKRKHDRINGIASQPTKPMQEVNTEVTEPEDEIADIADTQEVRQPASQTTTTKNRKSADTTVNKTASGVVYKVQILASNKKLPKNSRELKGYSADFYYEKGLYKYTYGSTSDWNEILKIQKSLNKDFKEAFVITFKDGVKVATKK